MLHFIQWLSTSFGTGHLIQDATVAVGSVACLFLSIILLARTSMGVELEDVAGDDSAGMHDVLDLVQIELRTVSQTFAYEVELCRYSLLRLRCNALRAREESLETTYSRTA